MAPLLRPPPALRSVVFCLRLALGHTVLVERVGGEHGGGRGVALTAPLALTASSPTASSLTAAAAALTASSLTAAAAFAALADAAGLLHTRRLLHGLARGELPCPARGQAFGGDRVPLLSGASCLHPAPGYAVAAERVGCKRGLLELSDLQDQAATAASLIGFIVAELRVFYPHKHAMQKLGLIRARVKGF